MVRLQDEEIDEKLKKFENGLTDVQKDRFRDFTSTVNARQYAKKSNKNLTRMAKVIKKRVIEAYPKGTDISGYEKPKGGEKKKKEFKKPKVKKEKEIVKPKKIDKPKKIEIPKKMSKRQEKEFLERQTRRAPSGRQYSRYEIHEKVGSKRAYAWRKKHNIPLEDWSNK